MNQNFKLSFITMAFDINIANKFSTFFIYPYILYLMHIIVNIQLIANINMLYLCKSSHVRHVHVFS